jgi:hypothetical protein
LHRKIARVVIASLVAANALAWSASYVLADAPKASIKGPQKVATEGTIVLDARASVSDKPLKWKLDGPDVPFLTLDQDNRKGVVALVPSAPAGVYKFTLIAIGTPKDAEIDADAAILVVTVEDIGPRPPPPAPPTPVDPVTPPVVDDKPRPTDQLRVIAVYESSAAMTRDQLNALNSTTLAAYLNAHCMTDGDGRFAWRFWDKDVDASAESESWKAAWAQAKADATPVPKLMIFAGAAKPKAVPITSEAAALATLQQYGGK